MGLFEAHFGPPLPQHSSPLRARRLGAFGGRPCTQFWAVFGTPFSVPSFGPNPASGFGQKLGTDFGPLFRPKNRNRVQLLGGMIWIADDPDHAAQKLRPR